MAKVYIICKQCGGTFYDYISNGKKFCCIKCYHLSKIGIIPWNKGKFGYSTSKRGMKMSEDVRKKISEGKKGTKYTEEHRRNISLGNMGKKMSASSVAKRSGPNNYRWITDRTKIVGRHTRTNDPCTKQWRKAVWKRDGYKCRINNKDCNGRLEAHHILPWSEFPELRYEVKNGITLCHSHHPRKRNDEMSLAPVFQELVHVQVKQYR